MVLWLLLLGAAGVGIARMFDAPRAVQFGIALGSFGMAAMIWVVQPEARPSANAFQALVQLAFVVLLIASYVILFRRLKPGHKTTEKPTGFVLIDEDAVLAQDLDAKIAEDAAFQGIPWSKESFSVALRDDDRRIIGGGQVLLIMGLAEVRRLWVDADHRGKGVGRELIEKLEVEARQRGATRLILSSFDFQAEPFYAKMGYKPQSTVPYPAGPKRTLYTKDLE